MAETTIRSNPVYKTLNRPLTILGVERTLFATALFTGAGFQVLFSSLLGAIAIFAILLSMARLVLSTSFGKSYLRSSLLPHVQSQRQIKILMAPARSVKRDLSARPRWAPLVANLEQGVFFQFGLRSMVKNLLKNIFASSSRRVEQDSSRVLGRLMEPAPTMPASC